MNVRRIWIAAFCLLLCTVGLADTLKLKDGTVLEGKVQEVGDKYWIKLSSGETKLVNKADVVSKVIGDAKPVVPAAPAAPKPDAPAAGKPAVPSAAGVAGSANFQSTKLKA